MSTMRLRLFTCLLVAVVLAPLTSHAQSAGGVAKLKQETALGIIPADASFCTIMLRNREQVERLINSRAVQKLMTMPAVQQAIGQMAGEWENPSDNDFEQFKDFVMEEEELTQLLVDALSHEMFFYGGGSYGKLMKLFNEFNTAVNQAQLGAIGNGGVDEAEMANKVFDWVDENIDSLDVVETLIGMKLTNTERAKNQIDRLEELVVQLIANEEDAAFLKDAVKRRRIGNGEFLTLNLIGKMIPWDEMDIDETDIDPKRIEKFRKQIEDKTVTIALGVKDNYLLFGISKDDSLLAGLGKGKLLVDSPRFEPLREFADERLTQIGYANGKFLKDANSTEQQLEQIKSMTETFSGIGLIDEGLKNRIDSDVDELVDDLKKAIPEPGDILSFQFMTERGYEGYAHNWGENLSADASRPLSILNHVGGDPIMFAAGRTKYNLGAYDGLVKWVRKGYGYFEEFAVPQMEDEEQDQFEKWSEAMMPLVSRLNDATRNNVLPGLADGQSAFVLDAKQTSEQWVQMMPPTDGDMPLLDFAIIYGVSDKNALMKGFTEYFDVAQSVITEMNRLEPNQIPPVQIPAAETKDVNGGTIHYYRLPAMAGIDSSIAPNTGISDQFFVMSLMPKTTQRLLGSVELSKKDGPLKNHREPMSGAWHMNFEKMVTVVEPWIGYGVHNSDMDEDAANMVMQQVGPATEFIKCFKGASGVTYQKDGASVSHYEMHFVDTQ